MERPPKVKKIAFYCLGFFHVQTCETQGKLLGNVLHKIEVPARSSA